ncbi:MAG: hypothetical protein DDT31_01414 [Syntrophomonadaceae bacterium]|nr:hypothetical protein [Bacillota bacterium]
MSKGFVKWVGLASALLLFLVLATGCAAWFAPEEEPVEEPVAEQPEEPEPEPEPEPVEEVVDFGGRTIQVAAWWDLTPTAGTPGGDRALARLAELQEKFNFTVEWVNVPWDAYTETLTASVLAGDPFADKVIMAPDWFYSVAMRGFLQPLEELYDLTDPLWNSSIVEFGTIGENTYGIDAGERVWPQGVLFFNKTMFEREGLPNLYELVENRQWNWDKMIEIAKQATKDLDGDGVIDQWGIGAMDMYLFMMYSNMGSVLEVIDGRPTLTFGEPPAVEGLQAFVDMVHTHKVFDVPPEGSPWDWAAQRFQDGKTAMFAYYFWISDRFAQNMADDYGITLFPMGPRATEYVSQAMGPNVETIPMGVENPEHIALFWERWSAPFPEDLGDPDYWVPDFAHRVRDEESLDTLRYIWEHGITRNSLIRAFHSPVQEAWWGINHELTVGTLTPAVMVEERLTPLQTALDDAMAALKAQ